MSDDHTPARGGPWIVVVAAGLGAGLVFALVRDTIIDDTFITLSYARNVAFHLHWGLIPQHSANSATSPLNVLLLGAALRIVRNPFWAVGALFVGSYCVFGWCLARIVRALRLPPTAAFATIAVVLLNPLLLSVVGMEITTLGLAVFALLLWSAVEKRPVAFGIALGLTLLVRLDFVIVAVSILLVTPAVRRAWSRWLGPAVAIAAPWYVFSWIALGSAIPDTLAIKEAQAWTATFLTGPSFYAEHDFGAVVVSFIPAVIGLAVVVWTLALGMRPSCRIPRELWPVVALGGSGIVYFLAYSALAPPPYLWYFGPPVITTSVSGALIVAYRLARARQPGRSATRPRVAIVVFALLVLIEAGVIATNEQVGWTRPPIVGNGASASDYERIGRDLRRRAGDAPILVRGEIGAMAYYCECELLDPFSDRGVVVPLIDNTIEEHGPVGRVLLGANYANLDRSLLPRVPEYFLDFATGEPPDPKSWSTRSLTSGGTDHYTLRRSPASPGVTTALADELLAGFGRRPARVALHADSGGDEHVSVDLYVYALAHELRRRGIDAQLDHAGAEGVDVTVATDSGVGRVLRHGGRHQFAYHGQVTLAERRRLARRVVVLQREHDHGDIDNLAFFYEMGDIGKRIGRDVLVYVGDFRAA